MLTVIIFYRFSKRELKSRFEHAVDHNLEKVMEKIVKADCVIIDEISMISQAVFEAFDAACRAARKSAVFAGGLQVIVAGDFRQLPPVPNDRYGDGGEYAFQSPQFKSAIRHHVDLTEVYR